MVKYGICVLVAFIVVVVVNVYGLEPKHGQLLGKKHAIHGVSGALFKGEPVYSFSETKLIFARNNMPPQEPYKQDKDCKQWAVVTTIHNATTAMYDFVEMKDWCMVIVSDMKTPPYTIGSDRVVILDVEEQRKMAENEYFGKFFSHIPWNHFGRKNIGYLYAILNGAKIIWDFDDDNRLDRKSVRQFATLLEIHAAWSPDLEFARMKNKNGVSVVSRDSATPNECIAYNPYPAMGAPRYEQSDTHEVLAGAWPRGYPFALIKNDKCSTERYISQKHSVPAAAAIDGNLLNSAAVDQELNTIDVAVIQSLADEDPDVDGVFRLTRKTPFNFSESTSVHTQSNTALIPMGMFVPTNAQASLQLDALWGLLLPISVHGRVSDIWRGYFTQRLLWDIDKQIAFSPNVVIQDRNPHDFLGDMSAEDDLYQRSEELVKFLFAWQSNLPTLPARIEDLYVKLYERDYIKIEDVFFMQNWLSILVKAGHNFSPVVWCYMHHQRFDCRPLYDNRHLHMLQRHPGFTSVPKFKWSKEEYVEFSRELETYRLPQKTNKVLKILVMVKDEWPLLESFLFHHGELIGFNNIYVLDASTDVRCIAFLKYMRDVYKVNVIFSSTKLSGLEREMSALLRQLTFSADFLLKMDADEFLFAYEKDRPCAAEVDGIRVECDSSTSGLQDAINNLPTDGGRLKIGFQRRVIPEKDQCLLKGSKEQWYQNMGMGTFFVKNAATTSKAFFYARSFQRVDLGSHAGTLYPPFESVEDYTSVDVAIAHIHFQCFGKFVGNNRKACVSEGYVDEDDSEEVSLKKLLKWTGPDPYNITTAPRASSRHKLISHAQYLYDHGRYESLYYDRIIPDPTTGVRFFELKKHLLHVLEKYSANKILANLDISSVL